MTSKKYNNNHTTGKFAFPRGTARHYLNYAEDIEQRLAEHRQGKGSKLCAYAQSPGIGFTLAEVWIGASALERHLKQRKRAADYCPICRKQHHWLRLGGDT